MNNYVKITLIVFGVVAVMVILVAAGFFIGQRLNLGFGYRYDSAMNNWGSSRFSNQNSGSSNYLPGETNQFFGRGMMGRFFNNSTSRGFGMGSGMMGGYFSNQNSSGRILSIEEARGTFENYLSGLNDTDLSIAEIMVFDLNAYAVIKEESSGMGAMELLVDPDTLTVFPEYGPNRMWNQKYGMMGAGGCGFSGAVGCGTGWNVNLSSSLSTDMPISMDEAAEIASEYLSDALPGSELAEEGFSFYGYYTFDYMQDGQMAGMLSVNGTNGQVWPHTWHGQFIEEWELEELD